MASIQASHDGVKPGRLLAGEGGRAHDRLSAIQRARILSAMAEEVAERGIGGLSVAHVVARAGVSRRTFYELFQDREDCFLAAFDQTVARLEAVAVAAFEQGGPWRVRLRAGLMALLESLEGDPAGARLVIVESLGAGAAALERRQRLLAALIEVVERGAAESTARTSLPDLTAEALVGGALSVVYSRLSRGESERLVELASPLMGMIVQPYLGAAMARKESECPLPERAVKQAIVRSDVLQRLEMRLTYRTVCVLRAVAVNPGYSNRAVGAAAGIADQGQASKLLARLQSLGLVQNAGVGSSGAPNAWMLTPKGSEVHDALAA
jgi:AcrR family transcriptional regulator